MPIYAYKCESCGHRQDVLQKISDPLLTACPACGAAAFAKQVTAAGFQLKGSGWYVTDFRDGGKKSEKAGDKAEGGPSEAVKPAESSAAPAGEAASAAAPATTTPPASAPAAGAAPTAPAASAPSA